MTTEITHFHLFCGAGGGALGFNQGEARVGQLRARFTCLGGVDSDASAIRDFTRWLSRRPARRGGRLSRQTQQHVLNLLRVVLEEARLDGKLASGVNPARDVRPASVAEGEQLDKWAWLTAAEIDQLLSCAALPQEARDLYAVAIYTGLRQGELWALTWADVTLDGPRPQIVVSRSGRRQTTKSGKVRAVPLLEPALLALRRMREAANDKTTTAATKPVPVAVRPAAAEVRGSARLPVLRAGQGPHGASRGNGSLRGGEMAPLFPSATGGHRSVNDDGGWADKRRGQQRVQPGHRTITGIREGVRFHDLRHTCASHLVQGTWGRRWRLDEVRDFLGHSSITVTQRYAHLGAEALHEAAAATRREEEQCHAESAANARVQTTTGLPSAAATVPTSKRPCPAGSVSTAPQLFHMTLTPTTECQRGTHETAQEVREVQGLPVVGVSGGGHGPSGLTGPRSGPRPALSLVPSPTARPAGIEPAAHGLEGRGSPEDLRGLTLSGGPDVGRIAEEIIAHAAGGLELPADLADQLARAVLDDPLVQLAQQVLEGGDLVYAYAVRLAGKVLERRRAVAPGSGRSAG